ncbi:hypothetical protein ABZ725_47565 [Streptomyces sp. NPDC006872]|uniref:hypothetical protein n=1 Tax=Streptomyces sp. NPDC006872 TaxID=3155720 RepID=UPI0033C69FC2
MLRPLDDGPREPLANVIGQATRRRLQDRSDPTFPHPPLRPARNRGPDEKAGAAVLGVKVSAGLSGTVGEPLRISPGRLP